MVCIVSAYYKIPSKAPHGWYLPHIIRWFHVMNQLPHRVHFFTTPDVRDEVSHYVDTSRFNFHFIPQELFTALNLGREFWERQRSRDPEEYHSPELAMVWYEKRHFVRRVMEIDSSKVFIWCDAGCIRDCVSEEVAMKFGLRRVQLNDDKLHMQVIDQFIDKEFYQYPDSTLACAIMAGNRTAWNRYIELYEQSLLDYDVAGIAGSSDQYVSVRCVRKNPDAFKFYANFGRVDKWFQFLELL